MSKGDDSSATWVLDGVGGPKPIGTVEDGATIFGDETTAVGVVPKWDGLDSWADPITTCPYREEASGRIWSVGVPWFR